MSNNQFDWIPFYEEFADKLLAYKDNRQELIEKIKQVYEVTGIKLPTLERNENGDNEIIDIDPFTTFGLFNKQITDANRIKVTSKNISPKAKKYGIIEPTNKVGDLDAVESI
ncbi:MAG: hypothetical protein VZS12_10810, partial [Ruminococcus bromii]|nr:hypothetical protein [Ruminococcus bromii]